MAFNNTEPHNINPFWSFWMAGYECTDKLNCFGNRVDFINVTRHIEKIAEDYRHLSLFNIKTVREGIRWSKVEPVPYSYKWDDVRTLIEAARQHGIQQVWDLCHFGFPDDITPLHPLFTVRFVNLCREFVKFYRSIEPDATLIVTPVNEVSFISWLGGEVRGTSPYCRNSGWEVKYHYMQAYIEGVKAILEIDPGARIMTTEPLVNIVPPLNASPEWIAEAAARNDHQFQVTDMLSGRMCPELGGKPEYLDIVGCNYYYNNQWDASTGHKLSWKKEEEDPRWLPLNTLIKILYERYKRPVVLSETSHPMEDRPRWIQEVTEECCKSLQQGVPLWGICWYPIIDRPDWDHLHPWHHAGIWDIDNSEGKCERILHEPTAAAFHAAQQQIKSYIPFKEERCKKTALVNP